MPPPLTLEQYNRIVKDIVMTQVSSDKPEGLDITIADFNQVLWHLTSGNGTLMVSVSNKCWGTLSKNGGDEFIKKVYGPLAVRPEPKFDVSLAIKLGAPMPEKEAAALAFKVSRLSRHMMAGTFHLMCDRASKREAGGQLVQLDYRPGESIWLQQTGDRVIVIFSVFFDDADDVVIGRVFLTEAGKLLQGAPSVDVYLKDPPKELESVRGLRAHGYASFLLEARHYAPAQREKTLDILMQFRNYLHYHIKCSKAYLHIRMRNRVSLLLQVLNRAKQEADPKKQTAFARKTC